MIGKTVLEPSILIFPVRSPIIPTGCLDMFVWEAISELLSEESCCEALLSRVSVDVSEQLMTRMLKITRIVIKMVHDLTVNLLFVLCELFIYIV